MPIGILFESDEWSDYALRDHIEAMGVPARLINLQDDGNEEEILSSKLVVSRIFASAVFRGHRKSHDRMPGIIELLNRRGIPMINSGAAHFYEISKARSTEALARRGFRVPEVYGVFTPAQITGGAAIKYPCVVKPDCGGRTNYTFIVHDRAELCAAMADAPGLKFIAEQYILPVHGFLTRVEVIGGACRLILKRRVVENGLSAYHLGSAYARYNDCRAEIKETAVRAMELLRIEAGSLDIIEGADGFYIIDVNAVSNVSEDNTETFSFDLMKETAAYVVGQYGLLK